MRWGLRPHRRRACFGAPCAHNPGMDTKSREHRFTCHLVWTGAERGGTADYEHYSREVRADVAGKPPLPLSAAPAFRGDPALHNPEDLLVAALSSCHFLSYAALCARSAVLGACLNVRINASGSESDEKISAILTEAKKMEAEAVLAEVEILQLVNLR